MSKLSRWKIVSLVCVFCAVKAIGLPAQTFKTLLSLNGTDGNGPAGPLVQGTDGNFYGTTSSGGAYGNGTVFKITPRGTLTTLHSFDQTDGAGLTPGWFKPPTGTSTGQPSGAKPTVPAWAVAARSSKSPQGAS